MGLMLHERIDALALARKETFRDVGAAGESDGIKAMRLATWEATVLPALRRAMTEHPELHGAKVKLLEAMSETFDAEISGEGWSYIAAEIRRGPLVADIEQDCAALAALAAREASRARPSTASRARPSTASRARPSTACAACHGDLPLTCEQCSAEPARAESPPINEHALAELERLYERGRAIPFDEALANIRRMEPRLRPLTRTTNALRSRVREMSPNDHVLLDEMRRFYERGGATS